ncbi:MAG: lipopolysaccharide biosynthesis protein [Alphaproteobacteria bacterium]|nr:lipopolysaccharide biosynthesis protein [Alphaproteobacteria bacterium]HPF45566.1 Wzz/FepE/Etk N-terminal domain-containing protein [Emcibacteraceae bacterium]HRW29057.1 Wzz/FepE/Etk N-terminal domain-containing protein [Emcibacteraceae bacterium]
MEYSEAELTLRDYFAILKRRYLFLIIPFVLVLTVSVGVALLMAPVYQSTGTIMVESQQIPDNFVQSTVTSYADERIGVITQRVMIRENLLRIIDKFNLFGDDRRSIPASDLVDRMRNMVSVEIISADVQGQKNNGKTAIAFRISVEHSKPNLAFSVANEFVTLFLDENVRNRISRASETTDFLNNETTKLKNQLEDIENQVADYKQKNSSALPEHLDLRINQRERAVRAAEDIDLSIKTLESQKSLLEIDLSSRTYSSDNGQNEISANPEQELAKLEAQLAEKSTIYGDAHPDIVSLKRKISQLKEKIAAGGDDADGSQEIVGDPVAAKIQSRIASIDDTIKSQLALKKELEQNIADLEKTIIQTPQVERGLRALNRNYENALAQYESIKAKLMDAQLSESLEEEKKAERFLVLEPPVLAEKPIRPNRQKIIMLGFLLAVAAGVGAIFLIEMIDGSVYGMARLTEAVQQQPLANIPYIDTWEETAQNKNRIKIIAGFSVASIVCALVLVHFLYLPLDIFFFKVWSRIS